MQINYNTREGDVSNYLLRQSQVLCVNLDLHCWTTVSRHAPLHEDATVPNWAISIGNYTVREVLMKNHTRVRRNVYNNNIGVNYASIKYLLNQQSRTDLFAVHTALDEVILHLQKERQLTKNMKLLQAHHHFSCLHSGCPISRGYTMCYAGNHQEHFA